MNSPIYGIHLPITINLKFISFVFNETKVLTMFQQYFDQAKTTISYLPNAELEELLNNDEKLEERVNEVLKILDREKEKILAENRSLAEENVNKEPEIIERKSRISELLEQGKTLCLTVQEQLSELKEKKGDKTPDTVLTLLRAAAAESEENSESIATKFQHSEIPIDEFLEQFTNERKMMHTRKLKSEKMQELIQKKSTQNVPFGLRYPGMPQPPSNVYPPRSTGAPYPPFSMPFPPQQYPHF